MTGLTFSLCSFPSPLTPGVGGLVSSGLDSAWTNVRSGRRPCLHAHAKGLQLVVEVLGGF